MRFTTITRRQALGSMAALGASALAGPTLAADAYPSKPIQLVLPFPPGEIGRAHV